jgi:hypothetical protein
VKEADFEKSLCILPEDRSERGQRHAWPEKRTLRRFGLGLTSEVTLLQTDVFLPEDQPTKPPSYQTRDDNLDGGEDATEQKELIDRRFIGVRIYVVS